MALGTSTRRGLAYTVTILAAAFANQLAIAPARAVIGRADGHRISYQPTVEPAKVASAPALGAAGSRALTRTPDSASRTAGAYKPCEAPVCLEYFGGPVMRSTTLTPVFWNPQGLKLKYPLEFEAEIERFFVDLAADSGRETNFFSVLTQYFDTKGHIAYAVASEEALHDEDALPQASGDGCETPPFGWPCVSDQGVRQELAALIAARKLPTGLGHEYVVFFPDGLASCFEESGPESEACSGTAYCGYHTTLQLGGSEGEVQYANEPENGQFGEGCTPKPELPGGYVTLSSTSHEIAESVTDPEVEGKVAWYDENAVIPGGGPYAEIGDMCAYEFAQGEDAGKLEKQELVVPAGTSNQTINGHPYLLQTEWDNAHSTCSISEARAATRAAFSDGAGSGVPTGTPIAFNAFGSYAPVAIQSYEWDWGDGSHSSSAQPIAEHTYASTQTAPTKAFEVTLTVTDANGNQDSVAHTVTVTDRAPTAAFAVPGAVTAGQAATFDGSASNDPDGPIHYDWDFGDGSPAQSETDPSHAYAAAGQYTVTLTVTDEAGLSASVVHAVTVAPPPPPPSSSSSSGGSSTVVTTPGKPTPPSNSLRFGRARRGRGGSLSVAVIVPGPGLLGARDATGGVFTGFGSRLDFGQETFGVKLTALATASASPKRGSGKRKALVGAVSMRVSRAGEVLVRLTPTAAGRRLLAARHRLSLSIVFTFAPDGGSAALVRRAYTLVQRRAARTGR